MRESEAYLVSRFYLGSSGHFELIGTLVSKRQWPCRLRGFRTLLNTSQASRPLFPNKPCSRDCSVHVKSPRLWEADCCVWGYTDGWMIQTWTSNSKSRSAPTPKDVQPGSWTLLWTLELLLLQDLFLNHYSPWGESSQPLQVSENYLYFGDSRL